MEEKMKRVNVLVTGGSGFLGSALIRHLLQFDEYCVWNLSMNPPEMKEMIPQNDRYTFIKYDLEWTPTFDVIPPGVIDYVVHMAGMGTIDRYIAQWKKEYDKMYGDILGHPSDKYCQLEDTINFHPKRAHMRLVQLNVKTTQNILEMACRMNVKSFFNISTAYVYHPYYALTNNESDAKWPHGIYAISKSMTEEMVRGYKMTFGLKTYNLRLPQMFGPYQPIDTLIPTTIIKAIEGDVLHMSNEGLERRDWLHCDEAAERIKMFFEEDFKRQTYNISAHHTYSSSMIVKKIHSMLNGTIEKTLVSSSTGGGNKDYIISGRRFEEEMLEKFSSIREGCIYKRDFDKQLEETVRFYLTNREEWCKIYRAYQEREPLEMIRHLFFR